MLQEYGSLAGLPMQRAEQSGLVAQGSDRGGAGGPLRRPGAAALAAAPTAAYRVGMFASSSFV